MNVTNRDPGDEQAMRYAIKWQEFWWDEELERGYVSDYTSDQTFEADTPEAAYAIWRDKSGGGSAIVRPENGALEMQDDPSDEIPWARWECAEFAFCFDQRAVDENGIEHIIPYDPSSEDDFYIRQVVDFYYAIYCGDLKAFGYGEGQRGVEDHIRKNHPEIAWSHCILCNALEPFFGPACLVCGNFSEAVV